MSYKVYKRPDRPDYYAYISVRVQGKSQYKRFSTYTTIRDKAIEIARATEQQMLARDGKVDITIGQAFGEFYKHEGAHYAAPRNVYYTLKQFADFFSEGRIFSSLTPADINRYIYAAEEDGKAPATINRQLVVLSRVINVCRTKWGMNAPDLQPLKYRQKEPDGRIGLVNDKDRLAIENAAAPHLRLAMQIAYYTGLRRGNILNLRWDDIDKERRTITVKVKDASVKNGRVHTAFIPDALQQILDQTPHDSEYVVSYNGRRVLDLKTAWHSACRRAGIPHCKYRFHDIRHASGTAVVRATQSLYAAQVHLGHKNPKMTQRYAKFLDEDKARIAHEVFDK